MPLSAATSAREILTGLHEIMAKRGSAQIKLDHVVVRDAWLAQGSGACDEAAAGRRPGRHHRGRGAHPQPRRGGRASGTVAEDIEAERERVYAAFRKMREQIDNMAREAEFGTVEHYWAGALRRAVIEGDVETGSVMAGQSVGMVTREEPVAAIIQELVDEAAAALESRG